MCIVTRQDVDIANKEILSFADWWAARQASCDQKRMVTSHALSEDAHKKHADLFAEQSVSAARAVSAIRSLGI